MMTNVIGSANILESVRVNKIKNLVYITSDKCYLNDNRKTAYFENDILGGIIPLGDAFFWKALLGCNFRRPILEPLFRRPFLKA